MDNPSYCTPNKSINANGSEHQVDTKMESKNMVNIGVNEEEQAS